MRVNEISWQRTDVVVSFWRSFSECHTWETPTVYFFLIQSGQKVLALSLVAWSVWSSVAVYSYLCGHPVNIKLMLQYKVKVKLIKLEAILLLLHIWKDRHTLICCLHNHYAIRNCCPNWPTPHMACIPAYNTLQYTHMPMKMPKMSVSFHHYTST